MNRDKLRTLIKYCPNIEYFSCDEMPRKKQVKTCSKCGEKKTIDLFAKNENRCKECVRKYASEYYANNTEKCLEASKRSRAANPESKEAAKRWQEKHQEEYNNYQNSRTSGNVLK